MLLNPTLPPISIAGVVELGRPLSSDSVDAGRAELTLSPVEVIPVSRPCSTSETG